MSLIPWRHGHGFDRFFGGDEDWFLSAFPRAELFTPAMNLKETESEIVAEMEIPGFTPEKVEVSVEDGMLRIKGNLDEEKEEKKGDYWRREIRRGSFDRAVRLPAAIKEDAVRAQHEKGVLTIIMPKAGAKPSAKVKVEIKGK